MNANCGRPDWECGTPDEGVGYERNYSRRSINAMWVTVCKYNRIDDDMSQQGRSTGAPMYYGFNQHTPMQITIAMSVPDLAWTSASPYTVAISAMLTLHQKLTGSFNGNLSHIVPMQQRGSAAGFQHINGICSSKC